MKDQRYPDPPVTDIASVEGSPHKHDIFVLLCSGWTPPRVAAEIERRHSERIPITDLQAFAKCIPDQFVLALSQLQHRYAAIDMEVDTSAEMQRLMLLARDRLDEALIHEQATKQQGTGSSEHGGSVDREHNSIVHLRAREYWKMLLEFVDRMPIMRDAEIPLEARKALPASDMPSLREIIEARREKVIAETTYRELPAGTPDGADE